ncbi:4-hydroxy-tetrahydrodipicolinate synthase [Alkanindiges illinoisensis]|uniref:4-hydroxy-tetrahydrodipicolinate synthase n=1 Tax=Alkanindiges illinoisensis TaxID=197183 RepID=A0A4Y7XCI2_9GAMM|nr:4-hydroxy-tetrahydrodipicolinate synthase [Alkanindiges illinoisensis]TEU26932.1 4-hydroxy-tetrahydrodipicolinate synthase [Alkanindiges illinoisensis]
MTQQATSIHGSIVALVTPMHHDGSVEWDALKKLVEWHIEQGTHSIVAVGTTGESATLDVEEHAQVIEAVIKAAAGRIPIIAGTGANSTREAIELTETARKLGADAALLVTPYYNKPTQEGLYQHYKAIAEAVDLPQILYNVPGRTGVDMHNDTVIRLADVDHIVGIKDATGDLNRGHDLINRLNQKIAVYSGDDATAYRLILLGAQGNISVTANVAPDVMSQVCEAAKAGNREEAEQLNNSIAVLHQILFCESNPIPVKWALSDMGLIGTGIRLPLTVLAESYQPQVHQALLDSGVIVR